MDCNKEEALRAKQLAEKKMEIKDFYGALKIAVKAQQLYPELENVSQMIVVCEVHCSAEKKSYGTDKDWYGILKIEPSADDISIKKQYRKLALVLHPDKNKFSGSTDAFKLIGEAQRVLLDREKRLIYDSKRRASVNFTAPKWNTRQPTRQPNVPQQHPWNQSHSASYTGGRAGNFPFVQQEAPTGVGGKGATFWTGCPFCKVRYQFYRADAYNKDVHCQSCKKSFTAYELNLQGAPGGPNTVYPQQSRVPPKSTEATKRTYTTKPVFEKKEPKSTKAQKNVNRKRKKRIDESSESSDSSSESEEEDVIHHSESDDNGVPNNVDKNSDYQGFEHFGEQPRRSSRAKRNVSYKENLNDNDHDDYATPSKQAKKSDTAEHAAQESSSQKEKVTKNVEEGQTKEYDDKKSVQDDKEPSESESADKGEESGNDDIEEEIETKTFDCPDTEFSDFEKHRNEESFAAKQLWACYDTLDAMPRFYAYIKKVSSPGFKLQIQWLKPDPGTPDEKKWVQKDLPVSCGGYKRDKHDKAEDLLSFSHLVSWEAGQKAGTFIIIPRKGETWAIFRNWSMNWHSSVEVDEVEEERTYDYDFVEILSDYDAKNGVRVSYLEKVKGFVCLFNRKEGGEIVIPAADKYRFAHMVPSNRMSGEERKGVPKGSYELDPAALPQSAFE